MTAGVLTGLRRRWLAGLLGLFAAGSLLASVAAQPVLPSAPACGQAAAVPWQMLVPGVWVWLPAEVAEVSRANAGHVAPVTAVVDGPVALVIDPGPSHAHGWRVRRSLECQFQAHVRWVVNTHAHAENVLGNSAFADGVAAGTVQILASAATREAMQQRCPACLSSLTGRVGEGAMAGTAITWPGHVLADGDTLRVGRHVLEVLRVEQGHTEGDLVLWKADQRVLWAGGLVYGGRVPELAQGHLDDWLGALQRLVALRPSVVVSATVSRADEPGGVPPALLATQAYLQALRAGVLHAMDRWQQPQEAAVLDIPAFRQWAGYAQRHGFNVQRAWREMEPVWMDQLPEPAQPSVQDIRR